MGPLPWPFPRWLRPPTSVTGTISNIDLTANTFELEGKTFTASPTNTVGAKLSELKDGDKVTVEATDIETGEEPINVMRLEKTE